MLALVKFLFKITVTENGIKRSKISLMRVSYIIDINIEINIHLDLIMITRNSCWLVKFWMG